MQQIERKAAQAHAQYLVYTLLPDLIDMGMGETAQDVRVAASYIEKLLHETSSLETQHG